MRNAFGGLIDLDKSSHKERGSLHRGIADNNARAIAAQSKLMDFQKEILEERHRLQGAFFEKQDEVLGKQENLNAKFLADLRSAMLNQQLLSVQGRIGQLRANEADMGEQRKGLDLFRKLGIGQQELDALRAQPNQERLAGYLKVAEELRTAKTMQTTGVANIRRRLKEGADLPAVTEFANFDMSWNGNTWRMTDATTNHTNALNKLLKGSVDDKLTSSVYQELQHLYGERSVKDAMREAKKQGVPFLEIQNRTIKNLLPQAVEAALNKHVQQTQTKVTNQRNELQLKSGIAPDKLDAFLKEFATKNGDVTKALANVKNLNEVAKSLRDLTTQLKAAEAQKNDLQSRMHAPAIESAKKVFDAVKDVRFPHPFFRANGGQLPGSGSSPFKARGTDTVPAIVNHGNGRFSPVMLTPNEYIVRADQASKHRPLLDAINAGHAPRYMALGGQVMDVVHDAAHGINKALGIKDGPDITDRYLATLDDDKLHKIFSNARVMEFLVVRQHDRQMAQIQQRLKHARSPRTQKYLQGIQAQVQAMTPAPVPKDSFDRKEELAFLSQMPEGVKKQLVAVEAHTAKVFDQLDHMDDKSLRRIYLSRVLPVAQRQIHGIEHRLVHLGDLLLKTKDPQKVRVYRHDANNLIHAYSFLKHNFSDTRKQAMQLNHQELLKRLHSAVRGAGIAEDVNGERGGMTIAGMDIAMHARGNDWTVKEFDNWLENRKQFFNPGHLRQVPKKNLVDDGMIRITPTSKPRPHQIGIAQKRDPRMLTPAQMRDRMRGKGWNPDDDGMVHIRPNGLARSHQPGHPNPKRPDRIRFEPGKPPVRHFAEGGYVQGGAGGIDDIHARLSHGEYVMRREAVQSIGRHNLDAANRGIPANPRGGNGMPQASLKVPYDFTKSLNNFTHSLTNLSHLMTAFSGSAQILAKAMEAMPHTITMQGQVQHNHTFQGLEVLAKAEPVFRTIAEKIVTDKLRKVLNRHFGQAGPFDI